MTEIAARPGVRSVAQMAKHQFAQEWNAALQFGGMQAPQVFWLKL